MMSDPRLQCRAQRDLADGLGVRTGSGMWFRLSLPGNGGPMQDQPILHVLTTGRHETSDPEPPMQPPPCTGDAYTCDCPEHQQDRVVSILTGPRGAGPAAFSVRRARRAA